MDVSLRNRHWICILDIENVACPLPLTHEGGDLWAILMPIPLPPTDGVPPDPIWGWRDTPHPRGRRGEEAYGLELGGEAAYGRPNFFQFKDMKVHQMGDLNNIMYWKYIYHVTEMYHVAYR